MTKDEFIAHRSKSVAEADTRDPTGFFAFEFYRIEKNKDGVLSTVLSLSKLHQVCSLRDGGRTRYADFLT